MSSPHESPSFQPQPPPQQPQQPPTPSQQPNPSEQQPPQTQPQKLPIHTNHCRYCNHLLLATTREIPTLPRRKPPAQDAALILPLPRAEEEDELDTENNNNNNKAEDTAAAAAKQPQPHYTILLSTTIPDRKPTVVRREDGFEKRRLLRCGRCRVVVGYFLDAVHFPSGGVGGTAEGDEDEEEGEGQRAKVVYLLPGALMETGVMEANDVENLRAMDREWAGWMESS